MLDRRLRLPSVLFIRELPKKLSLLALFGEGLHRCGAYLLCKTLLLGLRTMIQNLLFFILKFDRILPYQSCGVASALINQVSVLRPILVEIVGLTLPLQLDYSLILRRGCRCSDLCHFTQDIVESALTSSCRYCCCISFHQHFEKLFI